MLDDQPGVDEQNDGIVECSPAHPKFLVVHHLRIEHVYVKMAVYRVYGVKYSITFGSLTMPVRIEIFSEYLPYRIFDV